MKQLVLCAAFSIAFVSQAGYGQNTRPAQKPSPGKKAIPTQNAKAGLNRELLAAVQNNDLTRINALLARGADLKANHGEALTVAIQMGNPKTVDYLIGKGANVNLPDWEGHTPLQRSLLSTNWDVTRVLLKKGADPKRGPHPELVLKTLWEDPDRTDLVLALIRAGAPFNARGVGVPLLIRGVEAHNQALIRALLDKGVSLNDHFFGRTPLRRLITAGYLAEARNLYFTIGPPKEDQKAEKILAAAAAKDAALAKLFLERGADLQHGFNRMALLDAAQNGNEALVRLFLEHGAPVNVSDREQLDLLSPGVAPIKPGSQTVEELMTGIYASAPEQRDRALRRLIEAVEQTQLATPEKADQPLPFLPFSSNMLRAGRTPLLAASEAGSPQIVRLLIEHGADVAARDHWGRTALMVLLAAGRRRFAQEIVRNRALEIERRNAVKNSLTSGDTDPDLADSQRKWRTWAAQGWPSNPQAVSEGEQHFWNQWATEGDTEIVTLLWGHGVNVNAISTPKNQTALHVASWRQPASIVQMLLKAGANPNAVDAQGQTPLILLVRQGRKTQASAAGEQLLHPRLTGTTMMEVDGVFIPVDDFPQTHQEMEKLSPAEREKFTPQGMKKYHGAQVAALKARVQAEKTEAVTVDVEVIRLLRTAGANPTIKDKSGSSALDWAKKLNYTEAANALQSP